MAKRIRAARMLAVAVLFSAAPGVRAGDPPATTASALPGGSWASIAQLPDWGGVWQPDWSKLFAKGAPPPKPVLTPAAAAAYQVFLAEKAEGKHAQSTTANCIPPGLPDSMMQPYPIEFLFTPGKVTVAIEAYGLMRRIFTDGRPLPDDPDAAFQGTSVGHWSGDGSLIVDTIGFDPVITISEGVPQKQMRVHEEMRLIDPGHLEVKTVITDPAVLAQPYARTMTYVRKRNWDIKEYVCEQNNHDGADPFGKPSMTLEDRKS